MEPFTQLCLDLQGGRFDIPDRMFHDMATTWKLSSEVRQGFSQIITAICRSFHWGSGVKNAVVEGAHGQHEDILFFFLKKKVHLSFFFCLLAWFLATHARCRMRMSRS